MKKRLYIVLGLLITFALSLSAREMEQGEHLYFNATPESASWWKDGTYEHTTRLWGKLINGSKEYWIEAKWYDASNCYLEIPQDPNAIGEWKRLILYRCNYNNRNVVFNQTGEINIDASYAANKNYIQNFYYDDGGTKNGANWWNLTSVPSGNPTSAATVDNVTKEVIEVCQSSVGDPLSLQPKLAGNPLTYDYDHSPANAWFKWNGSAWVALDGQSTGFYSDNNVWGYEGGSKLKETIGAINSHTYYFLWTEKPSRRRFVEVAVTKDCAPTCEITDFGVVTSSVNAHDSTYVLDGIVAFKDANGKTLRISVVDAKGEHHVDYVNPSTPLIFSLPNLFADGATGLVATANFLDPNVDYSRQSAPYTAPNAIIGIHTTNLDKTHGESATLSPSTPGTDGFKWHDGNTIDHDRVIPAYNFDTTIIYTYYEFEKAPEVSGNLIINGDFSTTGFNYGTENFNADVTKSPFSTISDYHYWGKDITSSSDFYTLKGNINGGMAIVKDANLFWKRYTKQITAKSGDHFALFDADNSGEKAAWKIETGATHPNLKLAKGTNYMFSFWVANINNYGEMNNAASLQFEISYSQDGGSTWSTPEKLGNPINLNDYPDNLWHQNSHVYVATTDASKVRISVKDLNTSSNPGGNDFALDDIRFQPISVVSQAIKHCQRFVVTIYEAPIVVEKPVITITQTPACGNTDFTMDVKVDYSTLNNKYPVTLQLTDNVYGPLFATPLTIDPAVNPNSITVTLPTATYAMLVADGASHTLTAKITRLDGAGVDKGGANSNTYTAPGIPAIQTPVLTITEPSCDKTTFDIQVAAGYTAFKGTQLHYEWDGAEWTNADNPTLSYQEATEQTATGKLKDLPADGLNHTLRVYSDNALDCDYTFASVAAPVVPAIDTANIAFSTPGCTDLTTTLTFDEQYTYQQGSLTYWVDAMTPQSATYSVADKSQQTLTGLTFANIPADGQGHTLNVSFDGANSCIKSYNLPAAPFSPVIDAVKITSTIPDMVTCATPYYTVDVEVKLHYDPTGLGKSITLHYNNGIENKDTTVAASAQTTSITGIQLYNMDETELQTIYAEVAGNTPVCPDSVKYTAPKIARITPLFDVTVSETACDELKYSLSGTVAFDMADGNLVVEYDATHRQVIAVSAGSTSATFSIADMTAAGTGMTLHAYFENSNTAACTVVSNPFDAPVVPSIDTANITFSAPGCTDLTTTLTFDLDYTYQQGALTYWVDGITPKASATFSVADKNQQTLTGLSFANIPADGKSHTLSVSFDGANSCSKNYDLPAVPFSPVITSVTVSSVPETVPCDADDYTITVTVVTPYDATGRNIVLSGAKDTTVAADGTSTVVTIKLTNIGGTPQTVTAAYEATPSCSKTSAAFTPPTHVVPVITVSPIDIVCNDETQITLPFKVVSGKPDTYDLALGTNHYAGTASGSNLIFTLTTAPDAGDYTAVVTASTSSTDCSTQVTVDITIADGSRMLSKWTDVLFIDNSDGRFVSYQWYENGYLMLNETQQRLYNPYGLTGSYYCKMTTTDGQIIYTCEQDFNDVTPSRSVNDDAPAAAPAIYDTMGRPVQSVPSNGIYIIIEERDGERIVKKVMVHE